MQINGALFHTTKQLLEDELLPASEACVFCGNKDRRAVYQLQQSPDVWLLKCSDCCCASASRMPNPQALNDYYATYYKSPAASEDEQVTFDGSSTNEVRGIEINDYPMRANLARWRA